METEINTKNDEVELELNQGTVNWNKQIETNIRIIGEKAKGYKIMHIHESRRIGKIYSWLMYAGIILGPLSGILSSISTSSVPNSDTSDTNTDTAKMDTNTNIQLLSPYPSYILPIISSCIAFLSGIIVAVTKYGKFEERSSIHKSSAFKYTSLESNIRLELSLPRKNRAKPVEYSIWVGKKFDELFSTSPLVSSKIYTNYVKTANKNGCPFPDEYKISVNIYENCDKDNIEEIQEVLNCTNITVKDEEIEKESNVEVKEKPDLKRNLTLTYFPELSSCKDGVMEYEFQRMMGFKN
jgi:hypothetical protein